MKQASGAAPASRTVISKYRAPARMRLNRGREREEVGQTLRFALLRFVVLVVEQLYGMSDVFNPKHLFRREPRTGRFLLIGSEVFTYTRPLSDDTIKTSEDCLTGLRITTTGHFRHGVGIVKETTKREQIKCQKIYPEDVDDDPVQNVAHIRPFLDRLPTSRPRERLISVRQVSLWTLRL